VRWSPEFDRGTAFRKRKPAETGQEGYLCVDGEVPPPRHKRGSPVDRERGASNARAMVALVYQPDMTMSETLFEEITADEEEGRLPPDGLREC
jgi:hypothetical protein